MNKSSGSIFLTALLVAAVIVVFGNTLRNGFVWDDEQFIQRNVYLTSPAYLPRLLTQNIVAGTGVTSNLYRPLQSLTHFLDVRLWGYQPWGHHLTNLILHAGATVAIFWWLCLLAPPAAACAAAALYGLHPMQSETVAYISGRGDTLAVLFLCLGLILFRRHRWWSLLCAACAMLSKESLALFPVFFWLHVQAKGERIEWRRHLPFWLLSTTYVGLRLTLLNFQNTLNFYHASNILTEHPAYRLFTYVTTLPAGLRLWLWPVDLHHERAWSVFASLAIPQAAWSAVGVAAWLTLIVWTWRRHRAVSVGLLWFLVATIPTSNLIVLINALFYDHWFLLPGLGLALLVTQLPIWQGGRWKAAAAVCIVPIFVLGWSAQGYNRVWHDGIALNAHILRYEPKNAKVHHNLGMALADAGRLAEGAEEYRQAIAISDEYPQPHHNLARIYEARGQWDAAADEYRKALAIDAHFYYADMALGWLELRRSRPAAAGEAFTKAIAIYPYAAEAYLGLAQVRWMAGDRAGAIAELHRGLAAVDDPRFHSALKQLQAKR